MPDGVRGNGDEYTLGFTERVGKFAAAILSVIALAGAIGAAAIAYTNTKCVPGLQQDMTSIKQQVANEREWREDLKTRMSEMDKKLDRLLDNRTR